MKLSRIDPYFHPELRGKVQRLLMTYAAFFLGYGIAQLRFNTSVNGLAILPLLFSAYLFGIPGGITATAITAVFVITVKNISQGTALYTVGLENIIMILAALVCAVAVGYLTQLRDRLKQANAQLEQKEQGYESALKNKDLLLRELNHRVKNNLQIISFIIEDKINGTADKDLQFELIEIKTRIDAIGNLYRYLYRQDHFKFSKLSIYFQDLACNLERTFANTILSLSITIQAQDDLPLVHDQLVAIGLIINELVTNSVKHSFKDTSMGEVTVSLKQSQPNRIEVIYSDDGDFYTRAAVEPSDSFGQLLIQSMIEQLQAEVNYSTQTWNGVTISFSSH